MFKGPTHIQRRGGAGVLLYKHVNIAHRGHEGGAARCPLNKVKSNMLDRTNIERMLINFTDMYVGCPRRQPVASSSGHPLPRRAARAAVPPRVHGV